jgi:hypothetical protein
MNKAERIVFYGLVLATALVLVVVLTACQAPLR